MVKSHPSKSRSCPTPRARLCHFKEWLVCAAVLAFLCIAPACSTAAAGTSVTVNPVTGTDSPACNVSAPCKTIAYAVQSIGASFVSLSSGPFNESTVNISNVASLVISGVPSATVFDCSRRVVPTGAAFSIVNSTVTVTGVTFQSCSNPTSNGGAVSASGSSVVVSLCSFINCSAASGGAMSVTGSGGDLFLNVQNSIFTANSATGGGSASCPADPTQPCSTWGGAIAAFEMPNVTIGGCTMTRNSAQASVPAQSQQFSASQNAVAGGGCVSVLFSGNSSGSNLKFSGSTFLNCTVTIGNNVNVGNGIRCCCA